MDDNKQYNNLGDNSDKLNDKPNESTSTNNSGSYEYKFSQNEEKPPFKPYQPPYQQPPSSGYSNQPPRTTTTNSWAQPPQPPQPQRPLQPQPPQQTQWSFNDYGPVGAPGGKAPKAAKAPKAPKPPKSPKSGGGMKVFAVLMSIMFVISLASLGTYVIYNEIKTPITPPVTDKAAPPVGETQKGEPVKNESNVIISDKLSAQDVYKKASPSVVGVVTYVKGMGMQAYSQGSGVILSADGYIVTNAHVVTSDAAQNEPAIAKIEVVLHDGQYFTATVVGVDTKTDIAVLKIEATNLVAAELGSSSDLEVGEDVIVIGNPDGLQFANSMSGGMVSALNREVETTITNKPVKYIQTDATINPGNSGGAMVNYYGQIVGIPVAKIVKTGFEGMGFAIPIDDAKPIVDSLIQNGYVSGRAKLGISYTLLPAATSQRLGIPQGLRVVEVGETSDAFAKGLALGDIITKLDGVDMLDSAALASVMESKKPNDSVELTVFRADETLRGETITMTVILSEEKPV